MTTLFSYIIVHDSGFAPNPYGGFLTLATCKPKIRRAAAKGDWLLGTGSVRNVGSDRVIYAANICRTISLEQYGLEAKYECKRPGPGREWQRHGDNIYHRDDKLKWHQRRNLHHREKNLMHDLSGENVIICKKFWYFGSSAPLIPKRLWALVKRGPGHRRTSEAAKIEALESWLQKYPKGINGCPSGPFGINAEKREQPFIGEDCENCRNRIARF
jgi:hypothetical protein